MRVGISTASLFPRMFTEDALQFFDKNKVDFAEVFLESFTEYDSKFAKVINQAKGDVKVHSIHTLTTQFEPQLYSINSRAKSDSFKILTEVIKTGQLIGADHYTFHGSARVKRIPININFDAHAKTTQEIIDKCKEKGIILTYENVHWCFYNYVGFFNEIRKRTKGLKGVLDIKQARQSGIDHLELVKEMANDIETVHLSDVDINGKMCLPFSGGIVDFDRLFYALKDVGFNGAFIIEAYSGDYNDISELIDCYNKLKEKVLQIF